MTEKEFLIKSYVETIFQNIGETNEVAIEISPQEPTKLKSLEKFPCSVGKSKLMEILNNCPKDIAEIAIYVNNELINRIEIAKNIIK